MRKTKTKNDQKINTEKSRPRERKNKMRKKRE